MRLELVPYLTPAALDSALQAKEIHGTCVVRAASEPAFLQMRVQRLHDVLAAHLAPTVADLRYVDIQAGTLASPAIASQQAFKSLGEPS